MKKRTILENSSGQSLPLVVLFMGLIIGAATLTIDYAKVSALRNESQTATSAAALAAAKSLERTLQQQYGGSNGSITFTLPSGTISVSSSDFVSAYNQANTVYQDNIRRAISHTSALGTLVLTYSESPTGKVESANELLTTNSTITLPLYIHASASGATAMNFGSALGISAASVRPESTAVFYADTSAVNNSSFVPLGMPLNQCNGQPTSYTPGTLFTVTRVAGKNHTCPSSPTTIDFGPHGSGSYGHGSFGWLNLAGNVLTVGESAGTPGSSEWNILQTEGVTSSRIVIFPVVNGHLTGHNGQVKLYGFITAKINAVNLNSQGKLATGNNAGFTFTVLSDTAENDLPSTPSSIQSGTPYWLYYSLAPNS